MSSQPPDVSVIIVTWNGRQHLEACLRAVAAQTDVVVETILVDNGSVDGTAAYVAEAFPWVRMESLADNHGFAGGNNAGARVARGRYLALLNNDTAPHPRWLRTLLDGLDEPNGFALMTSRLVYFDDPDVIDSAGDGFLRCGGAFKWHHGARVSAAPDAGLDAALESREVFGVSGAACLMPRAIFEELDGFDEDFFASHEDVDLSYRARLLGYRCRYVAGAVVRHRGSATLGRVSSFAVSHAQRNAEWLYLKNTPGTLLATTLPGHLLYTAAAAVHFARQGLLGTFLRAKWAAILGLPRMLRKRAHIQATRRVGADRIAPMLEKNWLGLKLREKQFDTGSGASA